MEPVGTLATCSLRRSRRGEAGVEPVETLASCSRGSEENRLRRLRKVWKQSTSTQSVGLYDKVVVSYEISRTSSVFCVDSEDIDISTCVTYFVDTEPCGFRH